MFSLPISPWHVTDTQGKGAWGESGRVLVAAFLWVLGFLLWEKLAGPVYELVFELSLASQARALRSHYVRNAGSWAVLGPA